MEVSQVKESPPPRKPFAAFVQEQRGGGLHAELSDSLGELVAAVAEHAKPGSITLIVKVAPNKDGGQTVTVTDKIKLVIPEGERGAAIYFVGEGGQLSRRNPMQAELPLREVPAQKPEPGPEAATS